jgi:hypothetical protein
MTLMERAAHRYQQVAVRQIVPVAGLGEDVVEDVVEVVAEVGVEVVEVGEEVVELCATDFIAVLLIQNGAHSSTEYI